MGRSKDSIRCPVCRGTGKIWERATPVSADYLDRPCTACRREGRVPYEEIDPLEKLRQQA